MPARRKKLFTMRMNEEEAERLDFIASHRGLSAASVFRLLLKQEEQVIRARAPQSALERTEALQRTLEDLLGMDAVQGALKELRGHAPPSPKRGSKR